MQKSQRPQNRAEHQWYKNENDTKKIQNLIAIVIININIDITKRKKEKHSNIILIHKKNFLTKALKIFTLAATRMERGREFHVPTTLLKKYLKTFVLAYLISIVNLSLCLNELIGLNSFSIS